MSRGALVAAALAGGAAAQITDPFAPGERGRVAASALDPWLPDELALAAGGELIWVGGGPIGPRRLLLEAAGDGQGGARFEASVPVGTPGSVRCAAGARADHLFSARRLPTTGGGPGVVLERFDPVRAAAGAPFTPVWTRTPALPGATEVLLATDAAGARLVAALREPTSGALRLEWIDGASGSLSAARILSTGTLRRLAVSADGSRTAVSAGADLFVFDGQGAFVFTAPLFSGTHALALSGDGAVLVHGLPNAIRVLVDRGSGYTLHETRVGRLNEVPARAALARDGSTYAIGWWDSVGVSSARFEFVRVADGTRLAEVPLDAPPGGLQNLPSGVGVSADGGRAAFSCWGRQDANPEALVVDSSGATLLSIDLPGSATTLAFASDGSRLAVAMKHAHANQAASTGEVRWFETGGSDLVLLETAPVGGRLRVAARLAGARRILFLVGARAAQPRTFAGIGGSLWIDRRSAPTVRLVPADGSGRADLDLPAPLVPGAIWSVQALARLPSGPRFTETVLDPISL